MISAKAHLEPVQSASMLCPRLDQPPFAKMPEKVPCKSLEKCLSIIRWAGNATTLPALASPSAFYCFMNMPLIENGFSFRGAFLDVQKTCYQGHNNACHNSS
jgi:hypothetical protein